MFLNLPLAFFSRYISVHSKTLSRVRGKGIDIYLYLNSVSFSSIPSHTLPCAFFCDTPAGGRSCLFSARVANPHLVGESRMLAAAAIPPLSVGPDNPPTPASSSAVPGYIERGCRPLEWHPCCCGQAVSRLHPGGIFRFH